LSGDEVRESPGRRLADKNGSGGGSSVTLWEGEPAEELELESPDGVDKNTAGARRDSARRLRVCVGDNEGDAERAEDTGRSRSGDPSTME